MEIQDIMKALAKKGISTSIELVTELCHEFNHALHGRNYYQEAWAELCRSKEIVLPAFCNIG